MATRIRSRSLERIKKRSVAEEAQDRLISAIATGRLSRGERIVESDIAADLGVSRIPVREAMQQLGSLGILEPAGTRGWQVSWFDERQIDEIYQVRLVLETMMLTAAQGRFAADPALLAPLDEVIGQMQAAAAAGDAGQLNRLDLQFHRYAASIAENRLAMRIWEGLSQHVLIIFEMEIYRIPDAHSVVAQHVQLRDVLARDDAAGLAAALQAHITGYRSLMLAKAAAEGVSSA